MRNFSKVGLTILCLLLLSGCGTRFILIQNGVVGVLMKPVSVEAMFPDKDGVPTPGKVNLPEGTLIQYPKPAKSAEGVTK